MFTGNTNVDINLVEMLSILLSETCAMVCNDDQWGRFFKFQKKIVCRGWGPRIQTSVLVHRTIEVEGGGGVGITFRAGLLRSKARSEAIVHSCQCIRCLCLYPAP